MSCRRWHRLFVGMTTQDVCLLTKISGVNVQSAPVGRFGYTISELCSSSIGTTIMANGS